jgi:hypothetical protein
MNRSLLAALGVPPGYRHTVLRHTFAWALLGVLFGGAIQQLGFIVRKTGGSPLLVTAVTAGPHAFALLTALYAPLLERRSARALVAGTRAACAAVFLLTPFLPAPAGLAVVGVVAVVAAKVGDTFYGRLLAGMYPQDLQGRLQSLPLFTQALVLAGASVLAGRLLAAHDTAYRWLLPALAPAGVAAAVLIARFPSPAAREQAPADRAGRLRIGAALAEAGRDRPFLAWTAIYSVASLGFWVVYASLPVYFASVLELDYWQNGLALAAYNVLYCLGFLVWGRLLDRVRSVRTMVASWSLAAVATLVTAIGGSWPLALLGQAVTGFALAGNDIAWYPAVFEFAPEHRVDRYMSLYMTAVGLRALLGGALGGALMEASGVGSRTALLVAAAVMILGGAGMYAFGRVAGRAGARSTYG